MRSGFLGDKRPTDDIRLFTERVVKQLSDSNDFGVIINVRDSLLFDTKRIKYLINYLQEETCIIEGLNIKSRYEMLSEACQFNIVSLFCQLDIDIPECFLINATLRNLALAYSEPPNIIPMTDSSIETHEQQMDEHEEVDEEDEPPPKIEESPMTPEFFNTFENVIIKYKNHQEELINAYLDSSNVKSFHDTCKLFFAVDRAQESIDAFVMFYILPYIKNLKNLANRLVVDPLLSFAKQYPSIVVNNIFVPLFFDQSSGLNQFQLMKSLFDDKSVQQIALKLLFEGRPPSLEGPLSDEAMKWLVAIVPKTPQLDDISAENILLHIKMQLEYQKKDACRCFMLFLKVQNLNESNKGIAQDMIGSLPEIMQNKAVELLEK